MDFANLFGQFFFQFRLYIRMVGVAIAIAMAKSETLLSLMYVKETTSGCVDPMFWFCAIRV